MPVRIKVRSDVQKALREFKGQRQQVKKAIARAMNRTADGVRSQFDKEIRQRYTIKKAALRRRIVVARKASLFSFRAEIHAGGKPVPLDDFQFVRGKRGASVRVKKGGPRKQITKSFVITASNGKTLILARGRYMGNRFIPNPKQTPVRLVGPGIPELFNSKEVQTRITKFAEQTFFKRLDHELSRLVK